MTIRWKSDAGKWVVNANFERRGWEEVDSSDDDWDIYWASVQSVKHLFGADSGTRLQPGQLVNHFPNHYELTRKDLMVKNIKRYQRAAKREPGLRAAAGELAEDLDIIPTTFVLPQDYALFVEEYRRFPSSTWIMKPSSKSQGKGIFLINKLSQVKKWSGGSNSLPPALRNGQESYVVSRYINNPLLIGGKKFDLRLYVVVTSYKPLLAYMSTLGFGRFCNAKYTTEEGELDNEFVHLTNVAIQKQGDDYNDRHGNKWTLDNLRLYLEATKGIEATDALFRDIEAVVIKSLKACQNIVINDRHCFELYGYDIIVDDTMKPWLIEVNASPSLTTTTQADRLLKFKVINDTINLITPLDWFAATDCPAAELHNMDPFSGPRVRVGSMHLIYDEAAEQDRMERVKHENVNFSGRRGDSAAALGHIHSGVSQAPQVGPRRNAVSAHRPRSGGPGAPGGSSSTPAGMHGDQRVMDGGLGRGLGTGEAG